VLEVNDAVRKAIMEQAPLDAMWHETFGRNGGSLWDDARDKIRQGVTTVEEATWALSDYPHPHNSMDAIMKARGVINLS
jgi:type II secretory ATPase GspE/PulE/Tfp pilus assembly ATPase PilB-like protein